MVAGGGGVERTDLLIKAFLQVSMGFASATNDTSLINVSFPGGPMPAGCWPATR
jgi:hypothetical protein